MGREGDSSDTDSGIRMYIGGFPSSFVKYVRKEATYHDKG